MNHHVISPEEYRALIEARDAAYRAGAEAMRERAAAEIDCDCDIRAAVLARNEAQGYRRAAHLCPRADTCCALTAAAIRSLPLEES